MSIPSDFEEIFKENLKKIEKENPIPEPKTRNDIELVAFQMQDMRERVEYLENLVETHTFESKNDPEYKRIKEYCVKFSVDLDNINVSGREQERNERRKLLTRLDEVSANLFKKCK